MSSRPSSAPLAVQVPPPGADRPSWTKVGVITAIGFVIGVAWPRMAGVRLGPGGPEASSSASSAAPNGSAESPAPSAEPPAAASAVPAPLAPAAPTIAPIASTVAVGHGAIVSCKGGDGGILKGSDCGSPTGLDAAIMPRLRKVADCPDAASAEGKLRLVLHVDFVRGVVEAEAARGPGGGSAPEPFLACARAQLAGTSLAGASHDHPPYTVAYGLPISSVRPHGLAPAPARDATAAPPRPDP